AVSNETANYSLFSTHVSAQVVLHTFVGGSTVFFGPAIGASIFTLFAFYISEVTRTWLLYQGLIFVLVMLYAPQGIGGLVQAHIQHWSRLSWPELARAYALAAAMASCLAGAVVFLVEAFGVIFSTEYAAARRRLDGGWPPLVLFGLEWQVFSLTTWMVPILLAVGGLLLLPGATRKLHEPWDAVLERAEKDRAAGPAPQLAGAVER